MNDSESPPPDEQSPHDPFADSPTSEATFERRRHALERLSHLLIRDEDAP